MTDSRSLKNRVMARIYLEYTKDILLRYMDYVMLISFVAVTLAITSIRSVLENMPKDNLTALLNFFLVAIRNTSFIIQAFVAGFLARVLVVTSLSTYRSVRGFDIEKLLERLRLNSNTEKGSL